MPFNKDVGSSVDYRAAKPTNWKDGDYKKWINNSTDKESGNNIFYFSSFVWSFKLNMNFSVLMVTLRVILLIKKIILTNLNHTTLK
jgi:hypothetical protein